MLHHRSYSENMLYKPLLLVVLFSLATILSGCPPLDYQLYVRNTTPDTAYLTVLSKPPYDTVSTKSIPVKANSELIAINKNSTSGLNENLIAYADSGKITLAIPSNSTAYIMDIVNSFSFFAQKTLIVTSFSHTDTIMLIYPYKQNKLKRKRGEGLINLNRTIVYYDIK